jgi:hypothetical protein
MPHNRRRNENLLPAAKIVLFSFLILILGTGGLYYVNAKNEVHRFGEQKKQLEREIIATANRDEMILARIAMLSSYESLRKRQQQEKEAFAKLVPVNDAALVRIPSGAPGGSAAGIATGGRAGDIQAVSNTQAGR